MTRIQFGWLLPGGPAEGMSQYAYMEGVQNEPVCLYGGCAKGV